MKWGLQTPKTFEEFGLDSHIESIAKGSGNIFPHLTEPERARLFTDTSKTVREEIAASGQNFFFTLVNNIQPHNL